MFPMTRSPICATMLTLALLSCGGGDAPAPEEPPASPRVSGPATGPGPGPTEDDPVARWAALVPDSLRHRAGACPFECCVYRDWTPTGDVPLRARPSHAEPARTVIAPNQTFTADSGFVQVTGVSLVAVTDSVTAEPRGGPPFLPGDTLVVLDYVGEGFWNVWDGVGVRQISGFWGAEVSPVHGSLIGGGPGPGAQRGEAREWWVHATTRAGEKGWFNADSVARLRGVDACGSPI
jgi:hypothetical protein